MVKIGKFFRKLIDQYNSVYKEIDQLDFYVVPAGYNYVMIFINPEKNNLIRNTDRKRFGNNNL